MCDHRVFLQWHQTMQFAEILHSYAARDDLSAHAFGSVLIQYGTRERKIFLSSESAQRSSVEQALTEEMMQREWKSVKSRHKKTSIAFNAMLA